MHKSKHFLVGYHKNGGAIMAIFQKLLYEIGKIGSTVKNGTINMKNLDSIKEQRATVDDQKKVKQTQLAKPQSAAKPKQDLVTEKVYGTRGRIEIPDLNISVPIYGTESGGAQQVIDREDSAVYLVWPNNITIADHCHQANFSNLNSAVPGKTKAYIVTPDSKKGYFCYKTQVGHIKIGTNGNALYDSNWEAVYTKNNGGLTMYTCIERSAPDVMDVRLTYWKPI